MSSKLLTVSDLAALIEAREQMRSELHALALEAYEQWRDLEGKIEELEKRLDHSYNELSGLQVAGVTVPTGRAASCPAVVSLGTVTVRNR